MSKVNAAEFWERMEDPKEMGTVLPIPHGYRLDAVNFYYEMGMFNDVGMSHTGPAVRLVIRKGE